MLIFRGGRTIGRRRRKKRRKKTFEFFFVANSVYRRYFASVPFFSFIFFLPYYALPLGINTNHEILTYAHVKHSLKKIRKNKSFNPPSSVICLTDSLKHSKQRYKAEALRPQKGQTREFFWDKKLLPENP